MSASSSTAFDGWVSPSHTTAGSPSSTSPKYPILSKPIVSVTTCRSTRRRQNSNSLQQCLSRYLPSLSLRRHHFRTHPDASNFSLTPDSAEPELTTRLCPLLNLVKLRLTSLSRTFATNEQCDRKNLHLSTAKGEDTRTTLSSPTVAQVWGSVATGPVRADPLGQGEERRLGRPSFLTSFGRVRGRRHPHHRSLSAEGEVRRDIGRTRGRRARRRLAAQGSHQRPPSSERKVGWAMSDDNGTRAAKLPLHDLRRDGGGSSRGVTLRHGEPGG